MATKYQITLLEDLAADLKAAASRLNVPLAQFIRQTVEAKLEEFGGRAPGDPFAWMDGLVTSSETDLASRVDEIPATSSHDW